MSKIPTAEEFLYSSSSLHDMWDNTRGQGEWDHKAIARSHIEFAKLHVEAALKAPEEIAIEFDSEGNYDNSILNVYPLTNIK